eukprot:GHRQ01022658.1.p1 GENE.GHRQ01022658.1~~GHRQ01022658.1.p1  ORF type:complete len:132 (-),score=50.87 GHRQ01022658.1:614-1009(-)
MLSLDEPAILQQVPAITVLLCCTCCRSLLATPAVACCCYLLQHMYDEKRQKAVANEQQRWQQLEEQRQHEEVRMQQMREAGIRGKQNKSSEHFDIISLSYHPTKEGKQLQYKVGIGTMQGLCSCGAGSPSL